MKLDLYFGEIQQKREGYLGRYPSVQSTQLLINKYINYYNSEFREICYQYLTEEDKIEELLNEVKGFGPKAKQDLLWGTPQHSWARSHRRDRSGVFIRTQNREGYIDPLNEEWVPKDSLFLSKDSYIVTDTYLDQWKNKIFQKVTGYLQRKYCPEIFSSEFENAIKIIRKINISFKDPSSLERTYLKKNLEAFLHD